VSKADKTYEIYVLELALEHVPESRRKPDAAGYLYVGWTTTTVAHRPATHASGISPAGAIFQTVVKHLGRPLTAEELVLRPDLMTETPAWPAEGSANRAERRQANKLKARGFVILSKHKHGIRAKAQPQK